MPQDAVGFIDFYPPRMNVDVRAVVITLEMDIDLICRDWWWRWRRRWWR
jgi:hypothetical protein